MNHPNLRETEEQGTSYTCKPAQRFVGVWNEFHEKLLFGGNTKNNIVTLIIFISDSVTCSTSPTHNSVGGQGEKTCFRTLSFCLEITNKWKSTGNIWETKVFVTLIRSKPLLRTAQQVFHPLHSTLQQHCNWLCVVASSRVSNRHYLNIHSHPCLPSPWPSSSSCTNLNDISTQVC